MKQKTQHSPSAAPKRGRPSAGKRTPLGLRVTPEIKRKLDAAALASGRSQSQEAELRLEGTFNAQEAVLGVLDLLYGRRLTGLVLALAEVAQITGTRAISVSQWNFAGGEEWLADPYAYDQVTHAVGVVLEKFRPDGEVMLPPARTDLPQDMYRRLGEGFAQDFLNAVATGDHKYMRADIVQAVRNRLGTL